MQRRYFVKAGALLATGLGALGSAAGAWAASAASSPVVSGPITGGRRGWPLGAYPTELVRLGYVEEEYFLSGTANNYRPAGNQSFERDGEWAVQPDGKWSVEPLTTKRYKTRLLVHRPRDPARFNGTVLVEWINVSPGHDNLIVPADPLYDGFVYVAVSAQYVGVHGFPGQEPAKRQGLTQWDPQRYGSLSHPGDSFSFDIYTQVGRLLKNPGSAINPLGNLSARKLIATGASQSAARLRTYMNALHLRDRVYDAYVPFIDFGNVTNFNDEVFQPDAPGAESRRRFFRTPALFRDDLDVPVMMVNSEQESVEYRGERAAFLQPDTDRFRLWEVAGAPHSPDIPTDPVTRALTAQRDGLNRARPDGGRPGSHVTSWHCTVAAYYHVHAWINGGQPPPSQPRLRFMEAPSPELIRDTLGIGTGGIRLPETEVPIEFNTGLSNEPGVRRNKGLSVPFTPEQLRRLYPTHEDYVRKVTAAAQAAATAGVIRPYRLQEYIAQAKATRMPPG